MNTVPLAQPDAGLLRHSPEQPTSNRQVGGSNPSGDTNTRVPSRSDLREELQAAKEMRDGLSKKIHDMRVEINKYQDRIAEIELALKRIGQEPRVSDHALLRYLERKMGFDLEGVRQQILGGGTKEAIMMGAVRISKDGCHLLVSKEGCITTVLDQNMKTLPRKNG